MTIRSILLGLLSAAFLCGVTYYNDMVVKNTFVVGNYLPISLFGGLIVFVLLFNPLLARFKFSRKAVLSGAELAVIIAITLFACYVPGRGLMHYFTTFMMMPHFHERTRPSWQGEPVAIEYDQIQDWSVMMERLSGSNREPASEPLRRVWDRMPAEWQQRFTNGNVSPTDGESQDAMIAILNAAVQDPSFHDDLPVPKHAPVYVRILDGQPRESFTAKEHAAFSRGLLELSLIDVLKERRVSALDNVPPRMLADISQDSGNALDGFVSGLAQGDESISMRDIPWRAWKRPMMFWVPLLLTLSMIVTGLALVLHRQWSSHEHLPYPTIEFARAILPEKGKAISSLFQNRLFWIGAGAVFFIHMTNYAHVWWPEVIIPIKTRVDFSPLSNIFTTLAQGGAWFNVPIFFTAVGFAYFLSSDVALSLGLAPYIYCLAVGIAANYGVSFGGGGFIQPSINSFLYLGGYVGMFVTVMYTGRRYYGATFARGLGLPAQDTIEPHAVWGARVFMAAFIGFILQLAMVGVEWQIAVLYTLGAIMIFTSVSRLLAEAGVIFVHPYCFPCAMLWGFMGASALGHGQLLILAMVTSLILIDPREALMPFVTTALQLGDRVTKRMGRLATWGMVAVVVGLAVGIPATLYWQYQYGAIQASDGWSQQAVPSFSFGDNAQVTRTLEAQGSLRISESLSGFARFKNMVPQPALMIAFSSTFLLVLLFTFLRHRFARWPLHPLIFLTLGTWQSQNLAFSFLIGWAIKRGATRFGGAALYRKLLPLMIGLVAGEVMGGVVPMVVGAIYHAVTGEPPKPFRILPG